MKYFGAFILLIVSMDSCRPTETTSSILLPPTIEHHLISSGYHRPDFDLYNDSVDYFLFALHAGVTPEEFARLKNGASLI